MMVGNRNDRQQGIPGWVPEKLRQINVTVVGTGQVANCIVAGCAALGAGTVRVVGEGVVKYDGMLRANEGILLFEAQKGESKAEAIAKLANKINPEIKVEYRSTPLDRSVTSQIGKPTVIIDATNDSTSKFYLHQYSRGKNMPFISASSSETKCSVRIFRAIDKNLSLDDRLRALVKSEDNIQMPKIYEQLPQGNATSGIAAGLAIGELRQIAMPISGDGKPVDAIDYDCFSEERDNLGSSSYYGHSKFENKTILLIGAGAIGNYASLWAAMSGARVIIVDGDTVDDTNLNRQIFYYNSVGKPKASELALQLGRITGNRIGYFTGFVNDKFTKWMKDIDPDLIIGGVDSVEARIYINNLAVNSNVPVVDGASSASRGDCYAAMPKVTNCFIHQKWKAGTETILLDLVEQARKRAAEKGKMREGGCVAQGDPSVIMPNLVVGSLALTEGAHILGNSNNYAKGFLRYEPTYPDRLSLHKLSNSRASECYSDSCIIRLNN